MLIEKVKREKDFRKNLSLDLRRKLFYNNLKSSKLIFEVQNSHNIIIKKLTETTVSPFKARKACASVVIHMIYACSIV